MDDDDDEMEDEDIFSSQNCHDDDIHRYKTVGSTFLVYINLQCGKHDLRVNKDAHGHWHIGRSIRRWI